MKKAFTLYFWAVSIIVGLICSCSTGPNYGKLIPKDAAFVMSFNVEKAVATSGMEGEEEPLEFLVKLLRNSNYSRATREKLEDIVDDLDEAGLDLREPLMAFYSPTYKNEFGVTGAVYDAQKLEDLVNTMAREALCNKVNTYGDLRYSVMGKMVLAFNDSWFFVTERNSSQMDEEAVLDEIEGLFMQDEEKSLYGTEAYEKMSASEGFVQILLQGEGLQDFLKKYPDFQNAMASMPQNIDVKDFAYLCDLSFKKGEIQLVGETLMLSDEAEAWMENFRGYGDIAGDFNAYMPADALFQLTMNVNGPEFYKQVENNSYLASMLGDKNFGYLKLILESVKGDCSMYVENFIQRTDFPELAIYVQTENADWLDIVLPQLPLQPKKLGKNEYSLPLFENVADEQSQDPNIIPEAYLNFGVRGGVSYMLIGRSPEPFFKVKDAQHASDGKNVYLRLDLGHLIDLKSFKDSFGRIEGMMVKQTLSPFDYVEAYTENRTKSTFRIVMKDKEEYPVKVVYDKVFNLVKNFL